MRFVAADRIAVIDGGTPELAGRLARGEAVLTGMDALLVREPAAAGAPAFVFGAVEFDAIEALLRARPELGPEGLAVLLGVNPAATVDERAAGVERGILVTGGELRGAWAPEVAARPPSPAPPPTLAPRAAPPGAGLEAAPPPQQHQQQQQQSAEPPAPGDAVLRRTPHLDAPDPLPAQAGATFTVRVWTDEAPARLGEEAEDVIVEAPPDVDVIELGVLLVAGAHLEVDGEYFRTLTIERDKPDSAPVEFALRVAHPDAPGDPELVAQFMYRGRPCGRIRRRWRFPGGAVVPAEATPAGVPVHTDARAVDLTVLITATGGGSAYTCSVHAPDVPGFERPTPAVEWPLTEAADAMIARALAKLVDRGTPDPERKLALKAAGRTFWNAAPAAFRDALWALHDRRGGAPGRASVYVASDEPLLPWEIMLPSRPRPGAPDEDLGAPLGAAFAVGRWVRGDASSPPQLLPVRDAFLIAPEYELAEQQLDASSELKVLEEHFGGVRLQQQDLPGLDAFLADHAASLLHFVCHGAAEGDDSVIFLKDFAPCSSAQLRESDGFRAACAQRLPVVFLNACDAGRGNRTLGPGGAGFPMVFGQLGARAIVAPLWPVTKTSAPVVAEEIYRQAIASPGRPLADVLAELRARSYERDPFDDSWAAYCLFGDPLAALQPV